MRIFKSIFVVLFFVGMVEEVRAMVTNPESKTKSFFQDSIDLNSEPRLKVSELQPLEPIEAKELAVDNVSIQALDLNTKDYICSRQIHKGTDSKEGFSKKVPDSCEKIFGDEFYQTEDYFGSYKDTIDKKILAIAQNSYCLEKKEELGTCIDSKQCDYSAICQAKTTELQTCIDENIETVKNEVIQPCKGFHAVAEINGYGKHKDESTVSTDGKVDASKSKKSKKDKHDSSEIASFDGVYKCIKEGPYSADYKACSQMVQMYNAAFGAEQAMTVAHQGVDMATQAKNSKSINGEVEKGVEGDLQGAGMNAAQRSAKTAGDKEASKLAFFSSKVSALGGMLAKWPTRDNLSRHCSNKEDCDYAADKLYDGAKDDLFPNADVKTAFTKELITTLGKSAQAAMLMAEYNKQANLISKMKKNIAAPNADGGFDVQVGLCEAEPTHPDCQKEPGALINIDSGFNFGIGSNGSGSNTFGVGTNQEGSGLGDTPGYAYKNENKPVSDVSMGNNDAKSAKDVLNAPSGANPGLGSLGNVGSGSGAGGGGGGGAGGGGGGNRAPASNESGAGGEYNYKSKFASGSGSYGQYVAGNKPNNLDSLYNKSGPTGSLSETDRGIASQKEVSDKNSNIWTKISGAHEKAMKDNRLLNLK
jgi:hypothetical protein